MSGNLPDIRSLTKEEIGNFFVQHNEKPFRGGQVWDWLWNKNCRSFGGMSNLPNTCRTLLSQHFTFHIAIAETRQYSTDGTIKTRFRLHDSLAVEGVLIPSGDRATACISSQVGCALGCRFCATGQSGFRRNLTAGEIVDQVTGIFPASADTTEVGAEIPVRLPSNIVFMGMGEPFLNYENVKLAIERITSVDGLGMSPQRITVSSVGLPKMIRRMADDNPRYHFALSLHAATNEKRNTIIPFNLTHPLEEISQALKYYHAKTGKRFTVEYVLFDRFNDTAGDAASLARFCRDFPVKINLIEYNAVEGSPFSGSAPAKIQAFAGYLEKRNMVVNIRMSRGKDIDAACGQLAGKS